MLRRELRKRLFAEMQHDSDDSEDFTSDDEDAVYIPSENLSDNESSMLWNEINGRSIFRNTMPFKKFRRIQGCIRFDDKIVREERRLRDKLAPIRDVYDRWNSHLPGIYPW